MQTHRHSHLVIACVRVNVFHMETITEPQEIVPSSKGKMEFFFLRLLYQDLHLSQRDRFRPLSGHGNSQSLRSIPGSSKPTALILFHLTLHPSAWRTFFCWGKIQEIFSLSKFPHLLFFFIKNHWNWLVLARFAALFFRKTTCKDRSKTKLETTNNPSEPQNQTKK